MEYVTLVLLALIAFFLGGILFTLAGILFALKNGFSELIKGLQAIYEEIGPRRRA